MKKLLLAGGAGFIGWHLADHFVKRNDFDMLVVSHFKSDIDRHNLVQGG